MNKYRKWAAITDNNYQEKTEPVRITTISDYMKLVGFKISLSLKSDSETITGTVKDLSDDGKYLILIKPENVVKNKLSLIKINKLSSNNNKDKKTLLKFSIPLDEIDVIEVVDRFLKE